MANPTWAELEALGHEPDEIDLLLEHDAGEELHPYVGVYQDAPGFVLCAECGDTEEGLMHNNTWRNVEPLMEDN